MNQRRVQTAMEILVEDVGNKSADPATFTVELLKRLSLPGVDENADLLLGPAASATELARTATTLLAAARIPARMIRGVYLQDQQRSARVVPWLEIHDGTRWIYFNPATGEQGLPDNFLVWWAGDDQLLSVDGGTDLDVHFSVQSNVTDPIEIAQRRSETRQSSVAQVSLFSLPIQTQAVYRVLLLIPLGSANGVSA